MKYSRQRETILNYLMSVTCHPTAEQIYENVRCVMPNISLGTVYRNLAQLEQAGTIRKLKVGPQDHFDGDLKPHAHFVCKACGKVYDVMLPEFRVPTPDGFRVESEETFLFGTCKNCNNLN